MILQWHITQRCNVRCKHCYQGEYKDNDPTYDQLIFTLDDFEKFVGKLWPEKERKVHMLRLTGGEPMLHKDWKKLAAEIRERGFSWYMMTNGTLITPEEAADMAELKPRRVQVSIDGGEEVHDMIRGEGNLQLVLEGVKNLRDNNVDVMVSFTANLSNMEEIPKVVKICNDNDIQFFWSDRYIPHGSGGSLGSIGPSDIERYVQLINTEKNNSKHTKVIVNRSLQFLGGGGSYKCAAGDRLLTILHNGNVMTCRRLNKSIGNIYHHNFEDMYLNNSLCKSLRDPGNLNTECKNCEHVNKCYGGLKCLAHFVTGDPFSGDPACPFLNRR